MDYLKLMQERHSVRKYLDKAIEPEKAAELEAYIAELNEKYDMSLRLVQGEDVFDHLILGYGMIKGCNNYIYVAGKDDEDLDERAGYVGELVVLKAQDMGLNTCWVGGFFSKKRVEYTHPEGHRFVLVIAIGYGENAGTPSKTKTFDEVSLSKDVPEWYRKGIEAVLLAPSAINQKKWKFELIGEDKVKVTTAKGPFATTDVGIAKCHFELGAGKTVLFSE